MTDILNKFSNLKKFAETLKHEIRMFYVFDEYTGHNYIYLTTDDQCYTFGVNLFGCLALGHNQAIEEPQYVPELSNKSIVDFFKGHNFMFGITSTNEVYCWGQNESGQLGLGFRSFEQEYFKPERNKWLSGKNIVDISCGYKHVIALTSNGNVYGWGDNVQGQVGCGLDDPIISKPTNLSSISSELVIKSITSGDYHSMAVTVDNFLFSWGANTYGQLATGDYKSSNLPKLVDKLNIEISKIICSKSSTYFLTKEGKLYYCGENYLDGIDGKSCKLMEIVTNMSTPFVDITSGSPNYYCLAKTDQYVFELMKNELTFFESKYETIDEYFIKNFHITHQTMSLRDNTTDDYNGTPIETCLIDHLNLFPHHLKNIIEFFYVFDDIDGKNCIYVTKDSKVYAFGSNYSGVLGIGTTGATEEPVLIKEINDLNIGKFYNGNGFMFAQNKDREVFCWGTNELGQLGLGYECEYTKPVKNSFLSGLDIVEISCGQNHALALTQSGDVYGWGGNEWGQVGCASNDKLITVPTRIDIFLKVKSLACGDYHSLALTHGRSVFSWGKNEFGQLGQFWYDKMNAPSSIVDNNIISIACNQENSYLLSRDGTLSVHGQNVCSFNASTSQAFVKLPGTSAQACICANNNGSVVTEFDGFVYELRRHEISLIKQDHFSFNHFMIDNYSTTHRTVHIVNYDKMYKLGMGSFGTVFKCKDKTKNDVFTLKILNNQGLSTGQTGKVYNELMKITKLKSNHLVNLEKIWIESDKVICIQTKYYELALLDVFVAKPHAFGRKFFEQMCLVEFCITLEIYRQIVDGINFLHSLKPPIIHRNLKPTNIFIDNTKGAKNFVKISDFCFSKFNDLELSCDQEFKNSTKYSMIDVINGKKFGFKTDVFNLSVIGEELFEIGLFLFHSNQQVKLDSRMSKVDQLIKSMQLNPNWEERPTCQDVLAKIECLYPTQVELKTCSELVSLVDSLKNYKITLFYEIIKSLLIQKN